MPLCNRLAEFDDEDADGAVLLFELKVGVFGLCRLEFEKEDDDSEAGYG